ncbi:MAG: response regulator [Leptolyngbyaceae cyanobacterium SM1_1_3]|nr:response regulator [Leptolyngbyaceae cyanobacterium SM1_1_3]NJN03096.1 response regulator [Leptolyngbyaceae cyanobacterium RM1_1_2]NJO09597.1 response regulator [Leptolyngbyaceae cyanobacterium SL_1_1]
MHILLIEDSLNTAKLMELELLDQGHQVTVARDGLAGLHTAQSILPDLVLLDWKLPTLSGPEICQRLRQSGYCRPIIFVTAMSDAEHQATGQRVGGSDYLVKPFNSEVLFERIQQQNCCAA